MLTQYAVKYGVKIVNEDWVQACIEASQLLPFKDFSVPVFKGLVISATGLSVGKGLACMCLQDLCRLKFHTLLLRLDKLQYNLKRAVLPIHFPIFIRSLKSFHTIYIVILIACFVCLGGNRRETGARDEDQESWRDLLRQYGAWSRNSSSGTNPRRG